MVRIVEDSNLYETWKSAIPGVIVLKKIDRTGELIDEVIQAKKTFHITPTERRVNQERAASEDLDIFQNGMVVPVRLIESAEDVEDLRNNPNHLSEDDMVKLFSSRSIASFEKGIDGITNPITLSRMVEMAQSEEVNATVRQLALLKEKLEGTATSTVNEITTLTNPAVSTDRDRTAPGRYKTSGA